jgi:1-acyl-sn-glycerol-3-phosphate acyltransferase
MTQSPARFVRDTVSDVRTVARGWRWGVGRRAPVPRSAEPFVPPRSTRVFPTGWARTPAANAARDVLLGLGMHWLLRSQVTVRVEGRHLVRGLREPAIFVANHSSHIDTPVILTTLPLERRRRTAVAAAADYFFDTWWRAAGSSLLFNTFPIERRGGSMSTTPADLLHSGWSLVWYPEGTRTTDGRPGQYKLGAAFVAMGAEVPVVPVAIRGAFHAMPRGQGWPSRGRPLITVRYGDPLRAGEGEGPRDFNRRIERAAASLLDEDAHDWYAARRRAATGQVQVPAAGDGAEPVARWRRVWEASREPVSRTGPRSRPAIWR